MPETSQQWYRRLTETIAAEGHRDWESSGWSTWPFDGELTVRELQAPAADGEPARGGDDGECPLCDRSRVPDPRDYLAWRDELWMLGAPFDAVAMPFLGFLIPRRHADLSDLTLAESARMGELLVLLERAITEVLDVPRVQLYRWGDGNSHLHWWVYGRPTAVLQLRGTFLPIWDDLLPGREQEQTRADIDLVAARLAELAGGEALPAVPSAAGQTPTA